MVMMVAVCGLVLAACTSPVGSRLDQTPAGVTMGNNSPNTVSDTDGTATHSATAAGASGHTTITKDGDLNSLFGGVPLGTLSLPTPNGRGVLNTNGDLSIKAKRVSTGGNGPTVIDELDISSNKSNVQATLGPLYQTLVPLWTAMSEDQKAQVVETLDKAMAGAGQIFSAAMDAAVKAFVPVP